MGLVLALVSLVLLLVQVLLIARAVLDWAVTLAGPSAYGSVRSRISAGVFAVTEPILAPEPDEARATEAEPEPEARPASWAEPPAAEPPPS